MKLRPVIYARPPQTDHAHLLMRMIFVVMLLAIGLLFAVIIAANADDRPLDRSTMSAMGMGFCRDPGIGAASGHAKRQEC